MSHRPPRRNRLVEPVLWGLAAVVAAFVLVPAVAELFEARSKEVEAADLRNQSTGAMQAERERLNRLLNDPIEDQKLTERYRLGKRRDSEPEPSGSATEENP